MTKNVIYRGIKIGNSVKQPKPINKPKRVYRGVATA